ncbi:MAG: Homeodomain-like domain [Glomeribacter sp. 1016415]|nr:Homeodomain-like domain [Glomeribacter sp. 1016415]
MSGMKSTDMRRLSREARHERRVQVIRLRAAGYTYDKIAAQMGLSRTGEFGICQLAITHIPGYGYGP